MAALSTSKEYASHMRNSRPRSRPKRGRASSRNFVWIWYTVSGSWRYESTSAATVVVTTSSWVTPSTKRPPRASRTMAGSASLPNFAARPERSHSSYGLSAGIRSSCIPAASSSSRMSAETLWSTLVPSGRNV